MAKDRQWLKQRLCTALGWDEVVVEGVVEAVAAADSAEEVDALVQVNKTAACLMSAMHSVVLIVPVYKTCVGFRITWGEELSLNN